MPFSYRRSKKIAPGVRLNLGKRGPSVSMGNRAGGVNIGRKGVAGRIGTPIKGLSYRSKRVGCALPVFTFLTLALLLVAAGCAAPSVPVDQPPVEVTRLVEVTRPVEVTRSVEMEVTRIAEVTRIVEVTRPVVETQIVEVTRIVAPPATATPAPAKASPALQPEAVIAAFQSAGLEAEQPRPLTKDDYGLAPLVGAGLRFTIPSICPDCGGRVFLVEDAADRARLKSYYEEMSKASALAFSWVFERAPILLQINGDLPEAQARKYEAALQSVP